ncbi:MAG: radical SAM protein, partial [Pseudomonadota bacterium]
MGHARPAVRRTLERVLGGVEVSEVEAAGLFHARDPDREADRAAIFATANALRCAANGDRVSFVVNRNINFTNICYMGCTFCGFAKRKEDAGAEWLDIDRVVERAEEAWARGGTEVCIQGGLHPKMPGTYYRDLVLAIKAALPGMHIHAFSPFEVWFGAAKTKQSYSDYLTELKACGLGSMPGTAAEIL